MLRAMSYEMNNSINCIAQDESEIQTGHPLLQIISLLDNSFWQILICLQALEIRNGD